MRNGILPLSAALVAIAGAVGAEQVAPPLHENPTAEHALIVMVLAAVTFTFLVSVGAVIGGIWQMFERWRDGRARLMVAPARMRMRARPTLRG